MHRTVTERISITEIGVKLIYLVLLITMLAMGIAAVIEMSKTSIQCRVKTIIYCFSFI